MMFEPFEVTVIGAGVVGLSAAIALTQRGYKVTVLDSGLVTAEPLSARVYAMNAASQSLLQHLGVWAKINTDQMVAYERMHIWEAQTAAVFDLDARMVASDRLGVMVEESALKQALLLQVQALQIPIMAHWAVDGLTLTETGLILQAGDERWQTPFVVIADGGRSWTRERLGIPMVTWSYDQKAIVAHVWTEKPHALTARQVFLDGGPLAFLPMANPHHCSIVWSMSMASADALMNVTSDIFEQQLGDSLGHRLGQITLLSERQSFPLQMRHVSSYIGSRWLLMGDAAHTVHPLAGLGLNLGLADLSACLKALPEDPRIPWTERLFRGYQRQRKHALWQTIVGLQVIHQLFKSSVRPVSLLRGVGLSLGNRWTVLKRMMIEHAKGETY